jgi:hypothetical protein
MMMLALVVVGESAIAIIAQKSIHFSSQGLLITPTAATSPVFFRLH